jgi:hypothetical protein
VSLRFEFQPLLLLRNAANTSFESFGLTPLGLELMIYDTWGEHATIYTTLKYPFETLFVMKPFMKPLKKYYEI